MNVNKVAVAAMQAILAGPIEQNLDVVRQAHKHNVSTVEGVAISAFEFAEAMVAESKKRGHSA